MKNHKIILRGLVLALAVMACCGAKAQTDDRRNYETYPHMFVSLQGGAQSMISHDYSLRSLATPMWQVSVGSNFNRLFGARLAVSGHVNKDGLEGYDLKFKHKYVTGGVDLMLNMSNLLTGNKYSRFNAILLAGAGLNYAWYHGPEAGLADNSTSVLMFDDKVLSHNLRAGMQLSFDICKHLDLTIEGGVNNMGYRQNCLRKRSDDWNVYALAGLTFKFGHKNKKTIESSEVGSANGRYNTWNNVETEHTATTTTVTTPKKQEPAPAVQPAAPAPVRHESSIFFNINRTSVDAEQEAKINEMVQLLKQHPQARITVTGYADRATGTASINQRLSKERAEQVASEIAKRGISRDRIAVEYKGDSVQPYSENDKNRVVIGVVVSE